MGWLCTTVTQQLLWLYNFSEQSTDASSLKVIESHLLCMRTVSFDISFHIKYIHTTLSCIPTYIYFSMFVQMNAQIVGYVTYIIIISLGLG